MSKYSKARKRKKLIPVLVLLLCILGTYKAIFISDETGPGGYRHNTSTEALLELNYDGDIAIEVNNNAPDFSEEEISRAKEEIFEEYSTLDNLGRCGTAIATICKEVQPPEGEKRTSLGSVTPSGWQKINFWSRCHLIGYQLSGENANEQNLITGTTRMNVDGMLPYENEIDDYLEIYTDNHVLYEVEPVFKGNNLVASGVHMQALSLEDDGKGVCFNVYVFNYQPGYLIDYKNGNVEDDPQHQTIITLHDKKSKWTGKPVEVDSATVSGSTGDIRYIYYTDKSCHSRTTIDNGAYYDGGAPSRSGQYYAKAVVAGDNWYPTAASNTATLIIK